MSLSQTYVCIVYMNNDNYVFNRFNSDFAFSTKLYKPMARILGPYVLSVASPELDMNQCTDMVVVADKRKHIALRTRKFNYLKYENQITFRFESGKSGKTECEKLFVNGIHLDYYLYGFCNKEETDIISYRLIDWMKFRTSFMNSLDKSKMDVWYGIKSNYKTGNDDNTKFLWIDLNYFKDSIVEAKYAYV